MEKRESHIKSMKNEKEIIIEYKSYFEIFFISSLDFLSPLPRIMNFLSQKIARECLEYKSYFGSRFHVLRSQTHFRRYRGRRVPFSCFACPHSLSAVQRTSCPVFMFCAPELIFGGTESVDF
jgi:hypothetical protein